jgi:hypothetical protein
MITIRWRGWSVCFQVFELTWAWINKTSLQLALDYEYDLTNLRIVAASPPTTTHRSNNHRDKNCKKLTAALYFHLSSLIKSLFYWCISPQGISFCQDMSYDTLLYKKDKKSGYDEYMVRCDEEHIILRTKKAMIREKLYLCKTLCHVKYSDWYSSV